MSADNADITLQVVESGRQRVVARLYEAVQAQVAARADIISVDPASVDAIVAEATERAGAPLWRIALAEAAADHYGIGVRDALAHPTVAAAAQLVGIEDEPAGAWGQPEPEAWAPVVADPWAQGEAEPPADVAWAPPTPPAADEELYIPPGYEEDVPAAVDLWPEPEGRPVPDPWAPREEPEPAVSAVPDPWAPSEELDEAAAVEDAPAVDAWGAPLSDEPAAEPAYEAPVFQETVIEETVVPEPAWEPEPAPAPSVAAAPVPEPPEPAPPVAAAPPQALRVAAVHTSGIESLKKGDKDIELRLSDAGLDVLKRSSGVAIGRLDWGEITGVKVSEAKGRRDRRKGRGQTLDVTTGGGQATFELVGLTSEEIDEHLNPMLERLRAAGTLAS